MIEAALTQIAPTLLAAKRIWVAYSGGVDSHVLLHSLAQQQLPIIAVHVHHGLQIVAEDWVVHCEQQAQQLAIPIKIIRTDARPTSGQSPEQAARQARYESIKKKLQPGDLVLTAHNQDDQAETLLLQLFRGAGPKGLAAMPVLTDFGAGILCRPFLTVSRADILNYATSHQLKWIEDPTNLTTQYARNFLRNEIIPLLKQRWPSLNHTLARSSEHQAQTAILLADLAEQDYEILQGSKTNTLSVSALKMYSNGRVRNVLRYWIQQQQLTTPTSAQLEIVLTDLLLAAEDKNPRLSWKGGEIRRYRDDLYAMQPLQPFDPSMVIEWDRQSALILPNNLGTLLPDHLSLPRNNLPVTIKFRQGGERCYLPNREGAHTLKKLLQEWLVPPWLRDRVPLIYIDDKLISVYGYSEPLSSS